MKLELTNPIKAINKACLKEKVSRNHIELFKKIFNNYLVVSTNRKAKNTSKM